MERKRKEILFPLLVVLCTAILFFTLGYIAASYFGTPYVLQTQPASETEQTSDTPTTTSTLSNIEFSDATITTSITSTPLLSSINTTATTSTTNFTTSTTQTTTSTSSITDTTVTKTTTKSKTNTTSENTTRSITHTTTTKFKTSVTTKTTTQTTPTGTIAITDKINLNTATKEELMAVPGIGPVIAGNIIQYREEFGPFTELIQLMEVKGIGEKRYNKWVEYFTID